MARLLPVDRVILLSSCGHRCDMYCKIIMLRLDHSQSQIIQQNLAPCCRLLIC
jgi:hypothetical protein